MDEVELHSATNNYAKHLEPFKTELMAYPSYANTATIKRENSDQVKIVVEKPHCDDLT